MRPSRWLIVLAVLAVLLACFTGAQADPGCTPGQDDGCLPTREQCATGEYNGYWDGGEPGRLALCVGTPGHVALYVGGTAMPVCGTVWVADQSLAGGDTDPNICEAGWPAPYVSTHVTVTAHDGVALDGWIIRDPSLTNVPIVLETSPYYGQIAPTGEQTIQESMPNLELLAHGYALALFSVRGTGNSGGCFDLNGNDEQLDHADIVNWLGAQPWSNGSVGQIGLSYGGTTPWESAIHAPPALKTIVVSGTITDRYLRWHTPQGLTNPELISTTDPMSPNFPDYIVHQSLLPPVKGAPTDPGYWLVDHAPVLSERICPEVVDEILHRNIDGFLEDRDAAFWGERRLIDHFDNVRASVLLANGFLDLYPHQWQDDVVWNALPNAPKRMLTGQWGHSFPDANTIHPDWSMQDWNDRLIAWLDAWLKGDGSTAQNVGVAEYQDSSGAWHTSTAWPPPDARQEALYFNGESLATAPGGAPRSYRSLPQPLNDFRGFRGLEDPYHSTISSALCPLLPTDGLMYTSPPATENVVVAGNAFAYLRVASDQPGGIYSAAFVDLGPDFRCDPTGTPIDAYEIGNGGADLRYYQGNMEAVPFPTDTPVQMRIDVPSLAHVIAPGHRLALVIGRAGDGLFRVGQPWWAPNLTFLTDGGALASHVVLPIVAGTFGGNASTLTYPERPFS